VSGQLTVLVAQEEFATVIHTLLIVLPLTVKETERINHGVNQQMIPTNVTGMVLTALKKFASNIQPSLTVIKLSVTKPLTRLKRSAKPQPMLKSALGTKLIALGIFAKTTKLETGMLTAPKLIAMITRQLHNALNLMSRQMIFMKKEEFCHNRHHYSMHCRWCRSY